MSNVVHPEFKVGDLVKHRHWNLYGIIMPSPNWCEYVRVMWTRGDYEKPPRGLCWMMAREFRDVDWHGIKVREQIEWASTPFPICDAGKSWIELIQREE